MSVMGILKEMITQHKKIGKLRKELHTHICDTSFGLIAVEKRSMEKRWGYPLLRHEYDWYPLNEIRRIENESEGGNR